MPMCTVSRSCLPAFLVVAVLVAGACSGDGTGNGRDDGNADEGGAAGAPSGGPLEVAALGPPVPVQPGPDAVARVDLDGLLPEDRQAVWEPGLNAVGGIPHREDGCVVLEPSGGDDTPAIQEALDTCPEGEVVQLGDGEFRITGEGLSLTRSNITLRGNGPDRTHLVKDPGSEFPVAILGTHWFEFAPPVDLAAGAEQGATAVELVEDPGLQPGELVVIDQLDDPGLTFWHPGQQQPGEPSRAWFNRPDRPVGQVVEVKSVDGTTVELTTPLHLPYPGERDPQLLRFSEHPDGEPVGAVRFSGIEDLHVHGGEGGDGGGNIHLFAAGYSWVRNVESEASIGGSVVLSACFRCEVRDSYLHSTQDPNPGGAGYGLVFNQHAADNLAENNMIWNFNKVMVMRATGGGNVIAYNYVEDGWISYDSHWPEAGLNASHFTTPHHELFEGNLAWNFDGETTWGNSVYITAFRNHLTGQRRSVPPLDLDSDDEGFRRVVMLQVGHWWYSFLGNILGTADQESPRGFDVDWGGQEWVEDEPVYMWYLGDGAYSEEMSLDDPAAAIALVQDRTIRHGNFDFVTGEVTWDPDMARRDLPPSLYLTEAPDFFEGHQWPWVEPEGGEVGTLPARERFDEVHGL